MVFMTQLAVFLHAKKASLGKLLKSIQLLDLFPAREGSSCRFERFLATAGTYEQVFSKGELDYFRFRQSFETSHATLSSLQFEDYFQVCAFISVIEKAVIPNLLKPARQHMQHHSAKEFIKCKRNLLVVFAGFIIFYGEHNT